MPKNIDDISLPERRRSIRNIPIPEGRRKVDRGIPIPIDIVRRDLPRKEIPRTPPVVTRPPYNNPYTKIDDQYVEVSPRRPAQDPMFIRKESKGKNQKVWYASGAGLIVLVFAALSFWNGATLAYTPRSAALTFENELFKAKKTGDGELLYSVVKLSRDKGLAAPASGEGDVSRKASGVIIVYNNVSAEAQTLIENTRFESPSGKIYRIQKGITIPGKKDDKPGSIEVTVYADQAGEAYNSPLTDFTVPGLKGSPRFETIYARSKTPISGGFVGKEKVVKAEDLATTKTALEASLKNDLWEEAKAEVPEDFILFPSLADYSFSDLPQTSGTGGSAMVNLHGDLYGVMFKKSDLARSLSGKKLNPSDQDVIDILSFDPLTLSFDGTPPADFLSLTEISFRVTGSAQVVWRTDEVALRADLVGRNKKDIPTILQNYPTVANASVTVRPFWKMVLPNVGEKITIKKLPVK